jgi:hypothetical protein
VAAAARNRRCHRAAALLVRPLATHAWEHLGGFMMLAGVLAVLLASVARTARAR